MFESEHYTSSPVPRPPPFYLPFAFTIIHGSGRPEPFPVFRQPSAPVYYCERKRKVKRGRPGNEATTPCSISALASIGGGGGGGKAMVGMGLLYPGPGYEAIICFTHCKQSKLEVGLGTRLQE